MALRVYIMRICQMSPLALLVSLALVVTAACGQSGSQEQSEAVLPSVVEGQGASTERVLRPVLASSDLSVGRNRLAFGLIDKDSGPERDARVELSTFVLTDTGGEGPKETVVATFRRWPAGAGGVYVASLNFDVAGNWGIGMQVTGPDGATSTNSIVVKVKETSSTPAVGLPAPGSVNKTVNDVSGLDQLTTDPEPDPELYDMTIAEAVDAGRPLMVSFATPAYCRTSTCGPQLDVVKELKRRYGDRVNFIHVEIYDNPSEIQGDLSRARLSPLVAEWGLPSDPWTFVIDGKGTVRSKFEGFATKEELEEALIALLG